MRRFLGFVVLVALAVPPLLAAALKQAGASRVVNWVVARTLPREHV